MTEKTPPTRQIDWFKFALDVVKFVVSALGAALLVKCGSFV